MNILFYGDTEDETRILSGSVLSLKNVEVYEKNGYIASDNCLSGFRCYLRSEINEIF